MVFSHARAPALGLALIAAALTGGCSDDEATPGGDGGSSSDASGMDGEDLCPGQLTFEALVADAVNGDSVFQIEVAEVGASNSTSSAPNGRAVLCLPPDADSVVRSSNSDYLTRLDTVSAGAVEPTLGTAQPYPIDVLSTNEADDVVLGCGGLTRDPAATLLLVSVVSYPDAQPLVGATVSIDTDSNEACARDSTSGQFGPSPDAEVAAGRVVLFPNVSLTGGAQAGRAAITVVPPKNFAGACTGPLSVELEAGGLSGAFFACQ